MLYLIISTWLCMEGTMNITHYKPFQNFVIKWPNCLCCFMSGSNFLKTFFNTRHFILTIPGLSMMSWIKPQTNKGLGYATIDSMHWIYSDTSDNVKMRKTTHNRKVIDAIYLYVHGLKLALFMYNNSQVSLHLVASMYAHLLNNLSVF